MTWFLKSSTTTARLVRTIVEVALAWFVANIGDIFALFNISADVKTLLIGGLTVVFTAVIGFINENKLEEKTNG